MDATTYRNIEIHAATARGTFRVNAFRGENDAIRGASPDSAPAIRDKLLLAAQRAAQAWREVFPEDDIRVVKARDPRVFSPENRRSHRV